MSLPPKLTIIHNPEPLTLNPRSSWGVKFQTQSPAKKAKIPEYLKAPLQAM